ncbi:MAG: 4-(cytidine 5'-diphospho)-2-C-methyl-D-erythritol kinase [Oscillospiraceae bacterium]|nr:4-(cytidine 5'-diphospho)-2-C-methyl-D-erythritol kinase [Oscillospiraceae bacterium]
MRTVSRKAYGKLNLTLDVLGKRDDGYHDLRTVMQTVSLCDDVTVSVETGGAWVCECAVCADESNLALRAARAFFDRTGGDPNGLTVTIKKRIPVGGGMAGGSADAAATLHALNDLYGNPLDDATLSAVGLSVGSDVPFCLLGGTALAEGRGEILTRLPPMPDCFFVLADPASSVSTPELYRALDEFGEIEHPDTDAAIAALKDGDLAALCGCMANVFEPVLDRENPLPRVLRDTLNLVGAMAARLTGTGCVEFGVFTDEAAADKAVEVLNGCGVPAFKATNV